MKKIFFIAIVCGILLPLKYAGADAAPSRPDCFENEPKTCGYSNLNVHIDLGNFTNNFVLLLQSYSRGGSTEYSVADSGQADIAENRSESVTPLVVDKNYFQSSGGLAGIFITVSHKAGEDGADWDYQEMKPKNQTEFDAHSYQLVVLKDEVISKHLSDYIDYLLKFQNKDDQKFLNEEFIDGKYLSFLRLSLDFAPTSRLECGSLVECDEDVTYVPKSVVDKFFILTQGKVVDSTKPLENEFYNSVNQNTTASTNTVPTKISTSSQTRTVQTPAPEQNPPKPLHWWQRFWRWLKSLF